MLVEWQWRVMSRFCVHTEKGEMKLKILLQAIRIHFSNRWKQKSFKSNFLNFYD